MCVSGCLASQIIIWDTQSKLAIRDCFVNESHEINSIDFHPS